MNVKITVLYGKKEVGESNSKLKLKSLKKRGSDQRLVEDFYREEYQVIPTNVMRSQLGNLGREQETALEVTEEQQNITFPPIPAI